MRKLEKNQRLEFIGKILEISGFLYNILKSINGFFQWRNILNRFDIY